MKGNKRVLLIGLTVLVALAAVFAAVYFLVIEKPVVGEKDITVAIIHSDASEKTVKINTDAEFLRQALEEKDLIQGTESAYGLYVITVDNESVDEAQQQWWCFTQDGQMLMTGVDTTPVSDGDKFEITFTVGW